MVDSIIKTWLEDISTLNNEPNGIKKISDYVQNTPHLVDAIFEVLENHQISVCNLFF